jgi:hypothetical protein
MMLAEVLFFALGQEEKAADAKNFLRTTMQQVQRAKTFEATIEQHDANAIFPGNFVQRLRWQSGVGFELVITERREASTEFPDFYSRGKVATSVYRDMRRLTESIAPRPMYTPSWEVAAGLNFSFLTKSALATSLFAEPKPVPELKGQVPPDQQLPAPPKLTYSLGPRREWQGQSVREIIMELSGEAPTRTSIFVHPTSRYVIGTEVELANGDKGWMVYRDIKINGEMPSDLGLVPGG